MVTALGIDVRKAFTLVFAIGGLAAALAGVLSGMYFGTVDPQRGTSLLIYAFIVVVIGGLGSIWGTAVAAVLVALVQQYANYYASAGHRRPLGRAAARDRPPRPAGRARLGGAGMSGSAHWIRHGAVPVVLLVVLLARPEDRRSTSRCCSRATSNSPGTLQLLALMLIFAGLAFTYDLLFGFTGLLSFGHALYFAVGVYVAGIAMTKWHWGFWPSILFTALVGLVLPLVIGAVSLRVGGIAFAMVTLAFAQAGSVLAFKNPGQLTGGEDGFGVDYTKLPVGVRRDLQHEEPLLARARLRWWSSSSSVAGRSTRRPATCGRRFARTSCASRCSACGRSTSS